MSIRKEVQEDFIKMNAGNYLHDWECNCIAALKNGLYFYNKALINYRIHSRQSVSIANIKKRSKKDLFKDKLLRRKREVKRSKRELDYFRNNNIAVTEENNKYILRYLKFLSIVEKVNGGNPFMWFYEMFYYTFKMPKEYLDIRYCMIDLFTAFLKQ